jgi:hypothetical protein
VDDLDSLSVLAASLRHEHLFSGWLEIGMRATWAVP